MNDQQFKEIVSRLDLLIRLTATSILGNRNLKEQVGFLSTRGFQPKEIAWLLGKTPNLIRVTLHDWRKKKKKSGRKETKSGDTSGKN